MLRLPTNLFSVILIPMISGLVLSMVIANAAGINSFAPGLPVKIADFSQYSTRIPQNLADKCTTLSPVERNDLRELIEKLKEVKAFGIPWGFQLHDSSQTDNGHYTASSFADDKRVVFSGLFLQEQFFSKSKQLFHRGSMDVLALHEALGALKYKDENYQVSFRLWFSLRQCQRRLKNEQTVLLWADGNGTGGRAGERGGERGGTGTGTGGGGDIEGIQIKMYLLETVSELKIPEDMKARIVDQVINADLVVKHDNTFDNIFNKGKGATKSGSATGDGARITIENKNPISIIVNGVTESDRIRAEEGLVSVGRGDICESNNVVKLTPQECHYTVAYFMLANEILDKLQNLNGAGK